MTERKTWEEMAVVPVGHVGDVLQLGGGKLSTAIAPDQGMELVNSPQGQE